MKKVMLAVISVIAMFATANAAVTLNSKPSSLDSIPVAVKTVSPVISPEFASTNVTLEFVVNETGKVVNIKAVTKSNTELVQKLSDAVSKWTFVPAYRNGNPVPVKVQLPVNIVGA